MSATELLQQVSTLPALEREQFVLAVLSLEDAPTKALERSRKPVRWPNVETRARRIFGRRNLPNLVLLEREEAAF